MKRHLDVDSASPANVLKAVNSRRKELGLKKSKSLMRTRGSTRELTGIRAPRSSIRSLHKKDLDRGQSLGGGETKEEKPEVGRLRDDIDAITADAHLLQLVKQESLIQKGLELLDTAVCPLLTLSGHP